MSVKKRGLGRGLSDLGLNELLSQMTQEKNADNIESHEVNDLKRLPLEYLQPGKYQPRKEMDSQSLEALADSIRLQGIIQPILVRKIDKQRYEIIAGERRWRAAQLAGLSEIPVLIRDVPDNAAIAMALIENIQRENLNAIEEALAFDRLVKEFSLTHQEIAKMVGKSRATISNLLRLLTLSPQIKEMVEKGQLEMGHARALLSLDSHRAIQTAKQIIQKNLSVRETELYIRRLMNLSQIPTRITKDKNLVQLSQRFSKRLGAKVLIKPKDENKGKMIVHYHSQEQLQAIFDQFKESI